MRTVILDEKDPADLVLEKGGDYLKEQIDSAENFMIIFMDKLVSQNKIDTIIEIPLQPKTELKAVYVYLTLKISDINKKRTIWNNSDQSFRRNNVDDYCEEINDFRDGPYSIERIKYLMDLVDNFMYTKTVDSVFSLQLERASKTFGCQ